LYTLRLERLMDAMHRENLDVLALNPGPSMYYLTGLPFHLMERPTLLLIKPGSDPVLVLPELESAKLAAAPYAVRPVTFGDNPELWPQAFAQAAGLLGGSSNKIGLEPTRLRVLELRYLENACPGSQFVSAENILAGLRMQKDANELSAMREAVRIAQEALKATIPHIQAGMSEKQLSAELVAQLLRAGTEPEMPFQPIVSGGPNSANPHASPSDRLLQPRDLLVIDWGAAYHGYFSDLTRTFAIGQVEPEYERIAELVLQANAAGRAAGKPGIVAGDVDRAARKVIADAGYGPFFTHRTGHGLGMEGHEPPYMFGENKLILAPGMTYTVEPGIYLPNRGGVRIEDDVVVTANGSESLSDMRRELQRIG
jgi:Xaa-Pro dipeptidase